MLKLKTPIKTVLNPELISTGESFSERIMGNYRQIGVELNPTDLLHVTNEPPEIFVMDGGMTNLFSSANVENTQIQKTKIINNLINRIVLSADGKLSYQDNVYITNILHKLGIRDEKVFLTEAQKLFSETKEHHEAVRLYWENLESLQTLIREYKTENHTEVETREEAAEQPVLHLHEEINKRLQTAAIYRILQNFYEGDAAPSILTNELMLISEQSRLSREILLTRLREEVRMEPAYLTYRHENYYEGDEFEGDEVTVESVSSRISSAVLLSLVDNIYDSVYTRIDHQKNNWLSTENTFYKSAENTLFRMEQNTAYLQYLYEQSKGIEENETFYGDEVSILRQMINIYESLEQRLQQSLGGNIYETDGGEHTFISEQTDNRFVTEVSPADMVHITNEGDINETETVTNQVTSLSELVDQTYQQSIVRNQQYLNALQKIVETGPAKESVEDRSRRMQQESRLSLENPEEFMQEYREADEKAKETAERIFTETEKLLSPQQQVAHELIREYLRAPERFYHSEVISENNLGVMLYDIHVAEQAAEDFKKAESESHGQTGAYPSSAKDGVKGEEAFDTSGEGEREVFRQVERIFENETLRERAFSDVTQQIQRNVGEQVILHRENLLVSQITNRVIERWHERRERPYGPEVSYEDVGISMVHRSKETVIDEDVIESMQQQIRRIETTQQNVTESTKINETENRTVINNIVNETLEHNTQAITDIVNTSVKRQLDEISDKVYGKIERQLKNEKRRRGM